MRGGTAMNLTRERAFRLRRNLADAGFCEGDIEKFIKLDERGERREQFLMLENRRRALLLQLHSARTRDGRRGPCAGAWKRRSFGIVFKAGLIGGRAERSKKTRRSALYY